jgi:rRNA maturation endonuclease Nob1
VRETEIYVLHCHYCDKDIELKVSDVHNDIGVCPNCGVMLRISWRLDDPESS